MVMNKITCGFELIAKLMKLTNIIYWYVRIIISISKGILPGCMIYQWLNQANHRKPILQLFC